VIYKRFTDEEAWGYLLSKKDFLNKVLYDTNITYNEEDILQDLYINLHSKIVSKNLLVKDGEIVSFYTIVKRAAINTMRGYSNKEILKGDMVC
jgi:hypothetical protein